MIVSMGIKVLWGRNQGIQEGEEYGPLESVGIGVVTHGIKGKKLQHKGL